MKNKSNINIPFSSIFYILGIFILSFIGFFVFKKGFTFFFPLIVAFCVSYILNPLVQKIEKCLKCKRQSSTIFVIIIILGLFIGISIIIVQFLSYEVSILLKNLPYQLEKIENMIKSLLVHLPISFTIDSFIEKLNISSYFSNFTGGIFHFTKQIPDFFVKFIFFCLFSFFFLLKMENIKAYVSDKFKFSTEGIVKQFKKIISGYFKAQLKIVGIMAIILFLAFLILKVPYAFLLSILVAFLDALPIFGTGTVLIPYAMVEIFYQNYKIGIGLIILYFITQIVRRIIEPKILGESIGLSTFMSILFLFLGYQIGGTIGLILGIPTGVTLKYLYELDFFATFIHHSKIILDWMKLYLKKEET